ncbi:MAG: hypothetical protein ACK5C5_02415 [Bacteroidota bacterium]|jgi:hypothetical protein
MKYFSILVVLSAFLITGNAQAQNASRLNGKAFWYMMKNVDGTGEEIHDNIRFSDNIMYSDLAGANARTKPAKVSERNNGESSSFVTTVTDANGNELRYECSVEGNSIMGNVSMKKADGTVSEMVLRGMTQEEFLRIKKMKDDYTKSQSK